MNINNTESKQNEGTLGSSRKRGTCASERRQPHTFFLRIKDKLLEQQLKHEYPYISTLGFEAPESPNPRARTSCWWNALCEWGLFFWHLYPSWILPTSTPLRSRAPCCSDDQRLWFVRAAFYCFCSWSKPGNLSWRSGWVPKEDRYRTLDPRLCQPANRRTSTQSQCRYD